MTQPEIYFHISEISTNIKATAIANIISANTIIKYIKNNLSPIKIICNTDSSEVCYTLANLSKITGQQL